jgi:hypothetical protein
MLILGLVLIGGVIGVAVWGAPWLLQLLQKEQSETSNAPENEKGNFKFVAPTGPWRPNRDAARDLAVSFVLARQEPSNTLALFYRLYKNRLPSEAEMQDVPLLKLRKYFTSLEWERKPKAEGKLGGQPVAVVLEFQGVDPTGVEMTGEVWAVGWRGIGYWFFTWCPSTQKETGSAEWDKLRSGFTLLKNFEGWTETKRESDTTPVEGLPYEINFVKGLWVPDSKPEKWDAKATVVLKGNDPTEVPYAGKAANFRIILLDKAPSVKDAFEAARKYLQEQQTEEYADTKIEILKDKDKKDLSGPVKIGEFQGHVAKLRVRNSDSRERYMVLGVVQGSENSIMLLCDCDYARKDLWEVEFGPAMNGFRAKK